MSTHNYDTETSQVLPIQVLIKYLHELDDLEMRCELAMDIGLYDTALETLKALKDRERIKGLINYIPPNKHFEYRGKIEQVLANSVSALYRRTSDKG